ncbi:MAG: Ldh family oxidoreductase [Candidatus Hodarchaeota archaeon]
MYTTETSEQDSKIDFDGTVYVNHKFLKDFVKDVFVKLGAPKKHAEIVADVLIASDLRGIDSHGIQRLRTYYERIKLGIYKTRTKVKLIKSTPTTAIIDGGFGLGPVIAYKSMKLAIKKAKKYGLGAVAVRNSSHFGIAGFYSLMAIKEGMIGITTTNTRPMVPPTFGVEPLLGTNPLTMGVPSDEEFPFIIDCATSIIQRGKVEVYNRLHKSLPTGLIITKNGKIEDDPEEVLHDLDEASAALLPLGGKGESTSGHKGYGYATFVEILSSALQEGNFLKENAGTYKDGSKRLPVGHFFLAINIENFMGLNSFNKTTGEILRTLRNSKKEPGAERIYTGGEKEYLNEIKIKKTGIPLNKSIQQDIKHIKDELGLEKYNFNF